MFAATAYATRRFFPVDPIYVADYETLRGITTASMLCFVTGYYSEEPEITNAGWFIRDDNDTTTPDDGFNVIVASNGKRWKRIFQDNEDIVLEDYVALRAFANDAFQVYITGDETDIPTYIAGRFTLDADDVTSADNNGTIIVDVLGRRWKRQIVDGCVLPEWFKTTAGTNWSDAIENALEYVSTNNLVLTPAARNYRLTRKIEIVGTTSFNIIGKGQDTTNFIFEGGDVGFDLYCPERTSPNGGAMVLNGFSVLKKSDDSTWDGTALKITTGTVTGGNPSLTASLDGIVIGGAKDDTTNTNRFKNGIHLVNCWQAQLSNIYVTGAIPLNTSADNFGIKWEDSTGSRATNIHVYRHQTGYHVSGSSEGPSLVNCVAVGVQDGCKIEGPDLGASNPGFDAISCHFNVARFGITADNRAQGNVQGCLFYERDDGQADLAYRCIYITGVSRQWIIQGNTFTEKPGTAAVNKVAVQIEGTSYNLVQGNQIRGGGGATWTRGVIFGATVTESACLDNLMDSPSDVQFRSDSTTPNTIRYRSAYAGGTPSDLYELTAQSIPNNTATVLTLANKTGNAETTTAADGAIPTARLIVPPNAKRVRIIANVAWTGGATGTRLLNILKNGAAFKGGVSDRKNATTAGTATHTVQSACVDVVPGDYFTFEVTHTQGAAHSISAATASWVGLEVVA